MRIDGERVTGYTRPTKGAYLFIAILLTLCAFLESRMERVRAKTTAAEKKMGADRVPASAPIVESK